MRIPETILQEINRNLSIVEVVSDYLTLEKKGSRYWGLCPFHGEKTPSFSVTEDENLFYCFGCHKGGSIFTFVMEMEGISFVEAVRRLAEKAGVSLPDTDQGFVPDKKSDALEQLYARLVKTFHYFLMESEKGRNAQTYLQERGIERQTIEAFELGYVPADRRWLYRFLSAKNYSKDFLAESGLFSSKYPDVSLFSDRLMFPIYNHRGKAVAFGGRKLGSGEPKYINSPETALYKKREILFGLSKVLPVIRQKKRAYVVEGYFDVLAMYQSGAGGAVAPLGTAFTAEQGRLLKRYVNEVVLLFDGDSAGIAAARKSIPVIETAGLEGSVVELPGGLDPADMLKKEGQDSLIKSIKYSINSFEYLVKSALKEKSARQPGGEREVVAAVAPYITTIDSTVKREGCVRYLSDTLRIDASSILADLEKIGRRKEMERGDDKREERVASDSGIIRIGSELFLMLAVVVNRASFAYVRSTIGVDDLEDSFAREIYIALEEAYRNGEESLESLIQRLDRQELKNLVYEKISGNEFTVNGESIIHDGVKAIRLQRLEERRRRVEAEIRESERKGIPIGEIRELVGEKIYLDQELKKGKGEKE
ncbi:DNA primase [Sediminispirochaeta smaragdinae]|uniref:DNA primase n=1 Tax=Sediminispirochaeta smaragdinae (strain DSM 11293 / JCM 15392 / SEBR 4228) TaxID=573413 RepID=E1R315_SEDSS|nr:DNA primase [Sediminispirochaeta smaragdinae]ADK81201.1 DNA primase [Sediminispirochaeta smaragdinae DSM 11293]